MSFLEDAVDYAADAVGDVVDAVGATLEDIAEWTAEALATAGEWAVGAAVDVVEWHLDATLEAGDTFLTALDDSGLFDAIDTVTVGLIDLEYDESGFSFNYGIEDVFGFGVKIGEGGVSADADAVFGSYEASLGEDGFSVAGSGGIDFGPFPYYEGHASVEGDGDLGLGGEGHLYLPTPVGMAGGEVAGDYQETDDGYVVSGSVTGGYYAPTGSYVKGGVHASYEEDAEGYRTNVGVHGEVGQAGVGSVKSSIDYTEGRSGDISYEGVTLGGEVSGMGMAAGGEIGYQHVETRDGEYNVVSGTIYGEAGGQRLTGRGAVIAGPDGVAVEGGVELETDPLGVLNAAGGYAGLGEGVVPGGIGGTARIDLPDDITGAADVTERGPVPAGEMADLGDVPSRGAGGSMHESSSGFADVDAGQAGADFAPEPSPLSPPSSVESSVEDLSASFGDAVDDVIGAPTDDFGE